MGVGLIQWSHRCLWWFNVRGIIIVHDGSMFVDCIDDPYPLILILMNLVFAFVFKETFYHIRLVIYPQSKVYTNSLFSDYKLCFCWLVDEEFLYGTNWVYRNLYVLICVSLVRGKYYCAWKLGQFRPIKTAKKSHMLNLTCLIQGLLYQNCVIYIQYFLSQVKKYLNKVKCSV